MAHQGYGFCEFLTEEDAEYACKIMNQIKLWGKPIRVNKVSSLLSGSNLCKCVILTGVDSVSSFYFHAAPCHRPYLILLLRCNGLLRIGVFGQKATGRRCEPVHWKFGR